MGIARPPRPVKYFVALLSSDPALMEAAVRGFESVLGHADHVTAIVPWTVSRYYEREMGPGLLRRFVGFANLAGPDELADLKLRAQRLEEKYRRTNEPLSRAVNIDPGYVEAGKIVLASTKNAGHRVYLHSGIYAEATLVYDHGAYRPQPYTYPDYAWPMALAFFASLRAAYLEQLKRLA